MWYGCGRDFSEPAALSHDHYFTHPGNKTNQREKNTTEEEPNSTPPHPFPLRGGSWQPTWLPWIFVIGLSDKVQVQDEGTLHLWLFFQPVNLPVQQILDPQPSTTDAWCISRRMVKARWSLMNWEKGGGLDGETNGQNETSLSCKT